MFSELVSVAKDGKAGKITKTTEVAGNEVTIGGKTTKAAAKKCRNLLIVPDGQP